MTPTNPPTHRPAKAALIEFLHHSIGSVTDAYLRQLAITAQVGTVLDKLKGLDLRATQAHAALFTGEFVGGRYMVQNNGTVCDLETKLMWMQIPLERTFTFDKALRAAQDLNARGGFAGYRDWHVPSKNELTSLVVEGRRPSICKEAFPDTPPKIFWTNETYAPDPTSAWVVYFHNGFPLNSLKPESYHVRLVRSGR